MRSVFITSLIQATSLPFKLLIQRQFKHYFPFEFRVSLLSINLTFQINNSILSLIRYCPHVCVCVLNRLQLAFYISYCANTNRKLALWKLVEICHKEDFVFRRENESSGNGQSSRQLFNQPFRINDLSSIVIDVQRSYLYSNGFEHLNTKYVLFMVVDFGFMKSKINGK